MELLNLRLEQFEGPLDLLLSLIQKHKIDIFDIPISDLTDQYLEYIAAMEAYNMEVSSDFILMASELTYIKSKMLLPAPPDSEDPRRPLVDTLLEHQRALFLAEFLKNQSSSYFDRFTKDPDETDGVYERSHSVELLYKAFTEICSRTPDIKERRVELFEKLENEKFVTVEEKIISIMRRMYDGRRYIFSSLFQNSKTVGETVAAFLAILQLVRVGRLNVERNEDGIYLSLDKQPHKEN